MTLDLDRLSPFAAMESMNMDETDRFDELGFVTWASSDEDGGPDVGITVGLGPELGHLWLGEITRDRFESEGCDQYADNDMGWWLMHYKPKGDPLVIGKLLCEDYQAREFFEHTLAPLLRSPVSTAPASAPSSVGEEATDKNWQSIETAPKDGTTVDCWAHGSRYENSYYGTPHHECMSEYCDSCPDDLNVECWRWSFGSEPIKPTHWMPLPAPPVSP